MQDIQESARKPKYGKMIKEKNLEKEQDKLKVGLLERVEVVRQLIRGSEDTESDVFDIEHNHSKLTPEQDTLTSELGKSLLMEL